MLFEQGVGGTGWDGRDMAETREDHCFSTFQRFTQNKHWLLASNKAALTFL